MVETIPALRIRKKELSVGSSWGGGDADWTDKISPFIHGSRSYSATLGAGDILVRAGGSYTYLPDSAGDHKSKCLCLIIIIILFIYRSEKNFSTLDMHHSSQVHASPGMHA